MNHVRRIRQAALLVATGLLVQLLSTLHWAPGTFVLFATVGLPLVLLGALLFLGTVWRILRERRAL
jgi:hypothetical protein